MQKTRTLKNELNNSTKTLIEKDEMIEELETTFENVENDNKTLREK